MKRYFGKELTERERIFSDDKNWEVNRIRKASTDEDIGSYSSMKPKSRSWERRKQFNENLNPLIRFLHQSVGRKWDDVYSEICSANRKDTTLGHHVFQHLDWLVVQHAMIKDGIAYHPMHLQWGGRLAECSLRELSKAFYVDTKDCLAYVGPIKPIKPKEKIVVYKIDEKNFLVKNKKGIWFRFVYSDVFHYETRNHPEVRKADGTLLQKAYSERSRVNTGPFAYVSKDDFELLPTPRNTFYLSVVKQSSKKEKRRYKLE